MWSVRTISSETQAGCPLSAAQPRPRTRRSGEWRTPSSHGTQHGVAFLQAASEFHVGGPMFRTSNDPCAALLEAGALGVPKTASPAPYSDMPPDAAVVKTAFFLVDHIFSPNEFHSKSSIPRGLQAPLPQRCCPWRRPAGRRGPRGTCGRPSAAAIRLAPANRDFRAVRACHMCAWSAGRVVSCV